MTIGDRIALAGVIVTAVGVGVSAWLTFLIMRLTKESVKASKANAEAAEKGAIAAQASYELSKHVLENQKRLEQVLRREYRNRVLRQAQIAYDLLVSLCSVERQGIGAGEVEEIRNRPKKPDLTSENIIQYFTDTEIEYIDKAWEEFESYIKHWYNKNGNEFLPNFDIRVNKAVEAVNNMNNLIHILKNNK
ncbi:hypothetical protein [Aneurinibacillus danicus]|uniref:DUF4760 domain-containing protein n=1 Tax=Aneurinibacillus danicus TaxID=267746 RepID=A0A511VD94_9BACL|nr:hypothetical protein [Aneurinibacillus danicus]GEN35918.1 hypothetical protein ADA01nite_33780 [Aneurinibacillus danicus]